MKNLRSQTNMYQLSKIKSQMFKNKFKIKKRMLIQSIMIYYKMTQNIQIHYQIIYCIQVNQKDKKIIDFVNDTFHQKQNDDLLKIDIIIDDNKQNNLDQNLEDQNFSDISLRLSVCKTPQKILDRKQFNVPNKKIRKKRGSYRKYTIQQKTEAIRLALKDQNIKQVSKKMNIPTKNLNRWIQKGIDKKRSGRKTRDPQMENQLIDWISQFKKRYSTEPGSSMIKKKAKQFSNFPQSFKASKGWYEKFVTRNGKKMDNSDSQPFIDIINNDSKSFSDFSGFQSVYMKNKENFSAINKQS